MIGSLRKASINRRFAEYIVAQFPDDIMVEELKIGDLPLYNAEYEDDLPQSYVDARKLVDESQLVLMVTPEYNRSIPGGMKNAIDVLSRPHGNSALNEKKVAIATASPGAYGGRSCAFDIRKSMLPFAAKVLPKPEVYLSRATDSLDDEGNVTSTRTQEFLNKFVAAVVDFSKE